MRPRWRTDPLGEICHHWAAARLGELPAGRKIVCAAQMEPFR